MESLKLGLALAAGLIGGGVLGRFLVPTKKPVQLSPRQKIVEVSADPVLNEIAQANFELQAWVSDNAKAAPFKKEWNSGTGYFDALVNEIFVGAKKEQLIYSICPSTGRMVIVLYKVREDGSNIVLFKRYSEPQCSIWVGRKLTGEDIAKLEIKADVVGRFNPTDLKQALINFKEKQNG